MNDITKAPDSKPIATFDDVQRKALAVAQSDFVPQQFQAASVGKERAVANCLIALEMAQRMNAPTLAIMQSMHVIHGKPGFSSAFLIAQINASGMLKGSLRFEQTATSCTAIGSDAVTGAELRGTPVTLDMAKAEGWSKRNGSKWSTMPAQMLVYRAASFWARQYAPQYALGMHTVEELQDMQTDASATATVWQPPKLDEPQAPEVVDQQAGGGQWPKATEGGYWVDSHGEEYDPAKHGWSNQNDAPSVKADGTFRAKRVVQKKAEPEPDLNPPEPEPAPPPPVEEDVNLRLLKRAVDNSSDADNVSTVLKHALVAELSEPDKAELERYADARVDAIRAATP